MKRILCFFAAWLVTTLSHGQQAPSPAPGTRVITLGTQGGPLPVGARAQPANAVVVQGRIYLVDSGNGVVGQLRRAGLDYRRVDRIFITHNHDDHNADWGTLMGLQWSTGRRSEIHVYGPAGTEGMLKGYLQYFEPNARIRSADARIAQRPADLFRAHDIRGGVIYKDDLVTVSAVENCHYHFDSNAAAEAIHDASYAYRFQTPDRVVVFSGDTGKCPVLTEFARDADLLVHEVISLPLMADSLQKFMASQPGKAPPGLFEGLMRHMEEDHTTPEDIGRLARGAKVKKVVLTHFAPGRDADPDEAYVDGVKQHYDGPVIAAKDLMVF
ncbi:MBL fold metallo-hydrolase [Roseateles koreensis]|uniref:MBL fold metallo-hydrolase n=1 Tax=Roseateles koreensis TaxID=2987526 RepID=A0ABT5KQC5_9BURK|nr:MBL fold metallo-hydrolase [Roseateles koreensis]MDC8784655.1 MBL fold metallo-hydrolase [Roseateles koreensis]